MRLPKADIRYAIGASLISVIASSSGAASAYVKEGYTNLRIGGLASAAVVLFGLGLYLHRHGSEAPDYRIFKGEPADLSMESVESVAAFFIQCYPVAQKGRGLIMKAMRFHEHGGIDKLRYEDAPDPLPGPGEVVVRVKACALNYLDIWERVGLPGVTIPLPHISGSDVAGIIEAVGPGVAHVKPGDKTLVNPGISCMACEECYRGRDNYCRTYSALGYMTDGGYAELVRIPAVNALPYPEGLDFTDAAAIPLGFMTAWHMLVTRCNIRPGEEVLIIGAGSGVGSAAIQIARLFRARVITTAGGERKLQKALELGADHVIDHTKHRIRERVRDITRRRGVDIVFEHVGAATWEDSISSLAHHARLVTCGATTGFDAKVNLRHLFAKEITVMGSYMGSKHELLEVLKHVKAGHLRPVVSHIVPLEEAAAAQTVMEKREHFGKVVLQLD